jgi:RNA polymerase sigma-70 factor (ECF subfamily)
MVKNDESPPPATQREDELLVREVLRGESGSFDTIVRRYQSMVYAVSYRLVRNREDALDIAQEVFVKAFRALHTWQPTGAFKSWLLRIATNMSIDHLRRRSRMPAFVERDAVGQLEPNAVDERFRIKEPSERASESELGAAIQVAVDKLPERQRTVFILRHYEGLSLKEIAEIMNCTEGTIKTHLFRATGKLRDELDAVRRDFMRG